MPEPSKELAVQPFGLITSSCQALLDAWRSAKWLQTTALLGGGLVAVWHWLRPRATPRVSRLFIHPVKACYPLEVPSVRLDELGFANDRRWAILDVRKPLDGRVVILPTHPRAALLRPRLDDHLSPRARLTLSAPGMRDLQVPEPRADAERLEFSLWGIPGAAADCGTAAAEWLSEFFGGGGGLRLARLSCDESDKQGPRCPYEDDERWNGQGRRGENVYPVVGSRIAFADSLMGTLLSASSLDDLSRRAPKGSEPFAPHHMRMNVILSNTRPYEEETWKSFRVAGIDFISSRLCNRCTAPNVRPETGERLPSDQQPLRLLSRYRFQKHVWRMDPRHGGPAFGMKFGTTAKAGVVHVGDEVTDIFCRGRGDRMY